MKLIDIVASEPIYKFLFFYLPWILMLGTYFYMMKLWDKSDKLAKIFHEKNKRIDELGKQRKVIGEEKT